MLGLECKDVGSQRAILADFVGLVTDASWKCSATYQAGWNVIDFDDSSWAPAREVAANGASVWRTRLIGQISSEAMWIWNPDLTTTYSYCRYDIST